MLRTPVWIAMFVSATLCAQTAGTVTGRVVAEGGQQALPAAITLVTTGAGVRLMSVTADEQGAFTIEAPIGQAVIIARADGYASEQRELLVRPGRANPNLNFSLARAGTLSGRVIDKTGAGVPGARVWLNYRGEARVWRIAEENGGEQVDAFGNFTVPIVAQGRPFVLHAESEGWLLSSSQTMMIRSPELKGVLLLLSRRGATVSGRVMDSGGRPVSGAHVHLRAIPADSEFTSDQRDSIAFSRSMNRMAVSREDGSYSFDGVPGGRVVVTANAQNRRAASEMDTVSERQTTIDLSLR
jgi:protocatechuate 3,4-dioxygenase beta subunit